MTFSKAFKITVVLLLASTMLTGCMNTRKLKDIAIVEGMGVDLTSRGTEVTVQTLKLNISKSSDGMQDNMTVNDSVVSDSFLSAGSKLSGSMSKRIFYGQNKLIIFGKSLCEQGIDRHISHVVKSGSSRGDVAVCMSYSSAKNLLESKEKDAEVPSENLLHLINDNEKTGQSVLVTTTQLLNAYYDKTSDVFLPVLKTDKEQKSAHTYGIAVFDGDSLAEVLSDRETLGFTLINGKADDVMLQLDDREFGKVSVSITSVKSKKSAHINGGTVYLDVELCADMSVNELENGSLADFSSASKTRLEQELKDELASLCFGAFYRCRALGSDSLRLGEYLASCDPEAYSRLCSDWKEYYKSSEIAVSINIKVGKLLSNIQVE